MSDHDDSGPPAVPHSAPEGATQPTAWAPVHTPTPPAYGAGQPYPPPGSPYPPPSYPPPVYGQVATVGLSSNSAAALSYLTFIPAIIFLVMEPYNRDRFVRFNAWQCIMLSAVWVGLSVAFFFFAFLHLFSLFFFLSLAIRIGLFVLWLIAIIKASKGEMFKIPVVGDIANSLAGAA